MKWVILLSGGPADNPWNDEKVVEAENVNAAINALDVPMWNVDAVVRADIWEDLHNE